MCDDFDPACLPEEFVSVSRPSKIIDRLIEKRRKLHEEAIACMRNRIKEINLEVDEVIKCKSVVFQQRSQEAEDDITECLKQLKGIEDLDLDTLRQKETAFPDSVSSIEQANRTQLSTIEAFYEFLVKTEKHRTEKIKALMKQTLQKLQDIGYRLPYNNEEYFGNEIIDLNKITLNNMQAFEDLKKELEIRAVHDMQMRSGEILAAKEMVKKCLRKQLRRSVSRFAGMIKSTTAIGNPDISQQISTIQSFQSMMQGSEGSDMSVPVTEKDVEDWLQQTRVTLAALDQGAKHLVSLYKNIIVILFNRFFSELDDFKKVIRRHSILNENEIEEFQSEIYTPTVDELDIRLKSDLQKLQMVWAKTIDKMKETVENTYNFLKGASSLWDKHFRRVREAQYLVLQDVENMTEVNNLSIGEYEAKLNILIDKLRQGPNEKKLNKLVNEVYGILDGIKNAYVVHCNTEIQVVQKYKSMVECEVEVLMAEISRLLIIYPPDEDRDPKKQRGRGSQTEVTKIDPDEALLPMQMLYCIFQVDAVKNWMFGLWEAINQYKTVGKSEIMAITESWLDGQISKIRHRLSVKLAFHTPRYLKVEFSIYQKRKRELDEHNGRLDRHKKAAEARIKALKEASAENVLKYAGICDSFKEVCQTFLENSQKQTFSSAIRMACATLNPTLEKYQLALSKQLNEHLRDVDDFWDELTVSGYLFLEAIKLFREGGNYSPEEITTLQKTLKKLETTVKRQLDGITNSAKSAIKPYAAQLEKRHAEVILTVSEVIKEFEHNEHTERLINRTHQRIKDEMYRIKMKQRQINIHLKKLVNEFEVNVGKYGYLDTLMEKLDGIFDGFYAFSNIIAHPQPIVLYSAHGETISEAKHSGDYLKCLYDQEPSEEDNFLSKLNRILYDSLSEIQRYSKRSIQVQ
ncbi:unnamed protein product [Acanthoscelides obtectus]|uniref:DUF4455 domain-containing protein n=3 Tax=Acanthoscelides obtectus TaxID=200917 RepID=A0A9P0NYE1_ACAOB|nr:unnamed protein product [Acanthoscelides obtectus]CAK1625302.1 hypothetical protein AOBTE_LOCUS3095 [Acanthoscelides obtectus]